jgi:hypothetical protein
MFHQPAHVLLIAVGLALVLPEPGRWNPFVLVPGAARALARDLPRSGRWAVGAGLLVIALVAAPAALVTWSLTSGLPMGLRVVTPDASPIIGLVVAGILLRLTFWLPPVWAWPSKRQRPGGSPLEATAAAPPREEGTQPRAAVPHEAAMPDELLTRWGAQVAAPVLLFALVGLYAPVVYRAALEVARGLADQPEPQRAAAPAVWLAYIPAHLAQRLVALFALLASRVSGRAVPEEPQGGPAQPGAAVLHWPGAYAAAAAGSIALALLIAIW